MHYCKQKAILYLLGEEEIRELTSDLMLEQWRQTQVTGSEIFITKLVYKVAARTCSLSTVVWVLFCQQEVNEGGGFGVRNPISFSKQAD